MTWQNKASDLKIEAFAWLIGAFKVSKNWGGIVAEWPKALYLSEKINYNQKIPAWAIIKNIL